MQLSRSDYRISCRNLWKVYGPHPLDVLSSSWMGQSNEEILQKTGCVVAVKDVSFDVREGEIFVVMGLSGSGKSTLVRCILRLVEPTQGQVVIDGEDITGFDKKHLRELRRHKMAMVFQHFGLLPHRRVLENVVLGLEAQGVDKTTRNQRAAQVLKMVGLAGWEERYPRELSGGMQQRVGLARALAVEPEILLFDEPFSALDPLIRRDMQDELISLQKIVQKTIIFITHDFLEAVKMGDRVAIMRDGSFVQVGTAEEIISSPVDDYVRDFTRDVPRDKVLKASSVMMGVDSAVSIKDSPEVALQKMGSQGSSSAFVISEGGRFRGLVLYDEVASATKRGQTSLEEVLRTDIPVASLNTILAELITLTIMSDLPIPVVDDTNTLRGVVSRTSIVTALSGDSSEPLGTKKEG